MTVSDVSHVGEVEPTREWKMRTPVSGITSDGERPRIPRHETRGARWSEIASADGAAPCRPEGLLADRTVALCHEWTLRPAGSEKVASVIADLVQPDAVYTIAGRREAAETVFPHQSVHAPRIGQRPAIHTRWDLMLPFLHAGWSSLDLGAYDVVITSAHSCVNAVRVSDATTVVSYCHTPMRYAWVWREELRRVPMPLRPVWPLAAAALRATDRHVARKVERFVANSKFVADRIHDAYGCESDVVHPPVATDFYTPPAEGVERGDYFLLAGRLIGYKRPEIAVEAARMAGVRLVIAGKGWMEKELRSMAGPETTFVGDPTDEELRELYRMARALVFPGTEDFGITPVEAMACGTPVLAYGAGGVAESVVDGVSGRLLELRTPEAFAEAMRDWPDWPRDACREVAAGFSTRQFRRRFAAVLADL
jgi:glycosyltransferase involved in cell wall biosynthesis